MHIEAAAPRGALGQRTVQRDLIGRAPICRVTFAADLNVIEPRQGRAALLPEKRPGSTNPPLLRFTAPPIVPLPPESALRNRHRAASCG